MTQFTQIVRPRTDLQSLFLMVLILVSSCSVADSCTYRGAGILPFVVAEDGSIKVLLAHESGRGWSSLGGGPKMVSSHAKPEGRCETRIECAIRESIEESRFVLSRPELESAIGDAKYYPENYEGDAFVTYVVQVARADVEQYTVNPVPQWDPGYHETDGLALVDLGHVVELIRSGSDAAVVPDVNDSGFYDAFVGGFATELEGNYLRFFEH